MTTHDVRRAVEETVAAAAERVPGVAALTPRLSRLLGGTRHRVRTAGGPAPVPGVHARLDAGRRTWQIEVRVSTVSGHRALDVTRAVRAAAAEAARGVLEGTGEAAAVTVTVTALV
ncbi:Asp23/Gls24 family envelope stress response protein [Streptomyces sp. TS71-3]|uniref:Asp23/Gls24 family envelope stress response protein n=1 Tax=Streptomyces sp. TS71-3 TaxID=2733862 RepID=UPI001AFE16E2|nr:Asp23/Gls24 family envelope stress response protein [Streptomyces sp. TS71-3]GHJ39190.1 hypothetical protein Sm713_47990 [Streptomyces sp. TS71-3]